MKTAAAVLVGAVIGGTAVYFGRPLLEQRWAEKDPVCEARVQILRVGDRFEVRPKNVCLHVGRRLKWDVRTPDGDTVDIVFGGDATQQAKPFKHVMSKDNPRPGVYKTDRAKEIDSNEAQTIGRWPYKVLWTPAGGTQTEIDPEVCIRGG